MINITFDSALIARQMQRLFKVPYAVQRALYPAVSEVLRIARADLATHLKTELPLPPRLIEKCIKLSHTIASGQGAEGQLRVVGKPLPLINYDVQPQEVTARAGLASKKWPGFTYSLRTGQPRQREELPGEGRVSLPFIAVMPGGHMGVYYRTAAGKLAEAYGPSMQYHATTPEVERMLRAGAEENFARILPAIVDAALAEHGGTS